LSFLIEHLGERTLEALPPEEELPEGVNDAAVGPLLDIVADLEALQNNLRQRNNNPDITIWVGFDALKKCCMDTLEWNATVGELKRQSQGAAAEIRRVAGCPSLHMWDPITDTAYLYGIGADAERVLTSIDPNGNRRELFVELRQSGAGTLKTLGAIAGYLRKAKATVESDALLETTPTELTVRVTENNGVVECPLCGKAETFEVNKSHTKRRAITVIMGHLSTESLSLVNQHRLLHARLTTGKVGNGRRIPVGAEA
jgi:hypothetical protein